jgi:hypothetical protein
MQLRCDFMEGGQKHELSKWSLLLTAIEGRFDRRHIYLLIQNLPLAIVSGLCQSSNKMETNFQSNAQHLLNIRGNVVAFNSGSKDNTIHQVDNLKMP